MMKPPERANTMTGMDFVIGFDAVQTRALFWTELREFDTEEGQKRLIKIELKCWWLVFVPNDLNPFITLLICSARTENKICYLIDYISFEKC